MQCNDMDREGMFKVGTDRGRYAAVLYGIAETMPMGKSQGPVGCEALI